MSKKDEALKLALSVLDEVRSETFRLLRNGQKLYAEEKVWNAIFVIKQALAEQPVQQQEPVVWMYVNKSTHETKFQKHMRDFVDHGLWAEVPLYGEPLANHELQCVCGAVWLGDEMVHLPDKRRPASKPWVGLTDEELEIINDCGDTDSYKFARAIEAKLKEKNT